MLNLVDLCCFKKKLHGHLVEKILKIKVKCKNHVQIFHYCVKTDKSSTQSTKIKVIFIFEHYLLIFMDFLINSLYPKNAI